MSKPIASSPRSHATLGDIITAVLLAAGAAAENRRGRKRGGHRAWLAAIPIVGVNFVAFYGQYSYFQSHRHPIADVTVPSAIAAVVAATLESIAIYLAWQAHVARLKGDSALRLRLGAYSAGLVIGTLNYSHFCRPGWHPDAFAVSFALASVASPALWGIHSNRESRDSLKAEELIEGHGVRLGPTRWFWHPLLSLRVQSRAAWLRVSKPAEAVRLVDPPKWMRSRDEHGKGPAPAAGRTPPSAPRAREPRPAERDAVRAARKPGLTAAPAADLAGLSQAERAVALDLMGTVKLPGRDKLAREDGRLAGSRRAAWRVLAAVRASRNGGNHDVDG